MRTGVFAILTGCAFLIFAVTITFAPVIPVGLNYAARAGFLVIFAGLWRLAGRLPYLICFRPIFLAYFTAVLALSLGFFFGDLGLRIFGLTLKTPAGVAVAKLSQASLIVIGIIATTTLCGESLASLYIRKGRLGLGLGMGVIGAAVCLVLTFQQATIRGLGTDKLLSLIPWVIIFVVSNGLMEELLFRGLFLEKYEKLVGFWPAIFSTALAFTLAHMQVNYTEDLVGFLIVLLGLSVAWGWLMRATGSLWGSALFHAGADLLIIMPIFRSLGAG